MSNLRTPLVKPRSQGGTFYTFSSALEDVGLNINELKNKVALSHYVLLDIPAFNASSTVFDSSLNKGDYSFAESFQNYVLNMETVLRNQKSYNYAESLTVSERVFWKWMQKNGWLSFKKDDSNNAYYIDSSTFTDNSVIKGFGAISSGAQRADSYGIYNETFVQIPSSYGQMKVLLKPVNDKNYYKKAEGFLPSNTEGYLENIGADEYANDILYTGLSAKAIYDAGNKYTVTSDAEELCVDFSLADLRAYYGDETLSYDDIGIATSDTIRSNNISGDYKFNAVLVYYSIYDSTSANTLATNAYGLLILDSAVASNTTQYKFTSLNKKQSSTKDQGNAYSFRLNIKTTSVYNGDVKTTDNSTAAYQMSSDFNDTIRNLAVAVETLRSNANLISVLNNENTTIKELVVKSLDEIDSIQKDINSLKSGKLQNLTISELNVGHAAITKIDSSVEIGDYGSIDSSVFEYQNIVTDNLTADKAVITDLEVENILPVNDEIIVGENFAKISSKGVFTDSTHFVAGVSSGSDNSSALFDSSTAISVFNELKIKEDGTIILPNFSDGDDSGSEFSAMLTLLGVHNNTDESTNTYVSIKVLIAILITRINSLNSLVKNLLPDTDSDTADWTNLITQLNSTVSSLSASVSALQTSVTSLDSSIGTRIGNIDSSINSIVSSISAIDSSISAVESNVENLDSSISVIDSSISVIDSSINALYEQLDGIDAILENILS